MKEQKRNIDEFFLEELGNATEAPPSLVWPTLEKRLDQGNGTNKKVMNWWFYLLVALLFVGGSIAAFIAANNKQSTKQSNLSETELATTKHTTDNIPNSNDAAENGLHDNTNQNTKNYEKETNTLRSPIANNEANDLNNMTSSDPETAESTSKNNQKNTKNNKGNVTNIEANSATLDKSKKSSRLPAVRDIANKKAINNTANTASKNKNNSGKKDAIPNNSAMVQSGNDIVANKQTSTSEQAKSKKQTTEPLVTNAKKTLAIDSEKEKSKKQGIEQNSTDAKKPLVIASEKDKDKKQGVEQNITDAKKQLIADVSKEKNKNKQPETIIQKPKTANSNQQNNAQNLSRGLSGVPEGMEDDEDDAPTSMSAIYSMEAPASNVEAPKSKSNQLEIIEKALAQNPLAGAPVAAAPADPKDAEAAEAGGGGGGASSAKKEKIKRALGMTIGVKAGIERGVADYTATKFTGNIFGEIGMGKKLSLVIQPGIKFGQTNRQVSSLSDSYIDAGETTISLFNIRALDSARWDYAYRQDYDTVITSLMTQQRLVEIEIPFLFKYKVDKNFSIMGGLNFTFGKTLGSDISFNRIPGQTLTDTTYQKFDSVAWAPASKFSHPGSKLFSSFNPPEGSNAPSPIRFGYSIGFSYSFRQRLMLDVMIQQQLSGLSNIKDEDVRRIFAQPYVRLSIGCILFGSKK